MDFGQIKKWLHKMDQILDVYSEGDGFTLTEKELLLDYLKRIKDQVSAIKTAEDHQAFEAIPAVHVPPKPERVEIPEPLIDPIPMPEPIQERIEQKKLETEYITISNYDQLFDHLKLTDLSSKLENRPIQDIKVALGLNERIVALNELFKGDKAAFDETIDKLNGMKHFDEARHYLCSQVIPKYDWIASDKEVTVDKFIKIVSRRYL